MQHKSSDPCLVPEMLRGMQLIGTTPTKQSDIGQCAATVLARRVELPQGWKGRLDRTPTDSGSGERALGWLF